MKYQIRATTGEVDLSADWNSAGWKSVESLRIASARPEGSDHQPKTELKLQYDEQGLYGLFVVQDQYVRCVHQGFQGSVCRDSCVEFFLELPGAGYFNFEMNCGGGILTYYVRDNTHTPDGFKDFDILPDEDMKKIRLFHTQPSLVEPEVVKAQEWRVGFFIPYILLEKYAHCELPGVGTLWRMNAYKCGDQTSHPHWLSWNPVRELNFHRPEDFGVLEFC